jgi:hypothetical protein
VGCAFRCSILDNDKPAFLRAMIKGYARGTMFDNGRRNKAPRRLREPARNRSLDD